MTDEPVQNATVYFLTPDTDVPSGGVRVIYRHVDLLNSNNVRAFVLHQRRGFRCSWFEHSTHVTDVASAKVGRGDLLVVTEPDVDLVCRQPPGTRHVILNQSGHLTWKHGAERVTHHYNTSPDLAGVITVSEHSANLLRYAFNNLTVRRVHLCIDSKLFYPSDGPRERRIAYMPRRRHPDTELVLRLLRSRGVLDGWEVVALDGLSHAEVAAELRRTKIFLAFTYQEGFGLPAAEAMACGNYVIGYHGFGGREFLLPEFSAPVETGDVLGFARAIEHAIEQDRDDPDWCRNLGRDASRFIHAKYSSARECNDVVTAYSELAGITREVRR